MTKSGEARAHTNVVLIKYWDKKDEALIVPMNNNISVILEKFYAETEATFNDQLTQDQLWLNGEKVSGKELEKISKYMDTIKNRTGVDQYVKVENDNFVSTAAGLASSANAYVTLAIACSQVLDMQLPDKDLSGLARIGLGSASRSIHGESAEWEKRYSDETSYAVLLESNHFEGGLTMMFVATNQHSKEIPSRYGMPLTRNTSRFYQHWLDHIDEDLAETKAAIQDKDFKRLGEVIRENGLRIHAMSLGLAPPFTYLVQEDYDVMALVHERRGAGYPRYLTMDAEPDMKILVERKNKQRIIDKLLIQLDNNQVVDSNTVATGIEIIE